MNNPVYNGPMQQGPMQQQQGQDDLVHVQEFLKELRQSIMNFEAKLLAGAGNPAQGCATQTQPPYQQQQAAPPAAQATQTGRPVVPPCLLYTSDAADE